MNINRLFNTKIGIYIVSIILGLGLATLFYNKENNVIYKAPSLDELKKTFKFNNDCYKYSLTPATCENNKNIVRF